MNLCCLGNTRRHLTRCFLGSICLLLLRLSGRDWCADSVGQNVWVVLPGLSQRKVDVWFCLPLRICIFLCIACFLFKIRIPTKEFKFNHSAGKSDRHGWLYKSVPRLSQRFKHTNFSSKIPSPWQSTPQLLLTSLHSSAFWLTRPIPKTSTFQTFSQKQPTFKNTQKKLPNHSGLNSTTTVECNKNPHITIQDAPKCWFQKNPPFFLTFGGMGFLSINRFLAPQTMVPLGFPYGAAACAAAASAAAFSCRRRFSSCTSCRRYLSSVEKLQDFFPHTRFTTNALRFWVGNFFFKGFRKNDENSWFDKKNTWQMVGRNQLLFRTWKRQEALSRSCLKFCIS